MANVSEADVNPNVHATMGYGRFTVEHVAALLDSNSYISHNIE